jgi:hypothetical protein
MPRALQELLVLVGVASLLIVLGRMAWAWYRRHQTAIAPVGLLLACAVAAFGWLAVALIQRLSHVSSENFIWILMWPFMMLLGLAATAGGVAGIFLGTVIALSAPARHPEPGGRRVLLIAAGIVAALLNLFHIVRLVRLLVTG